MDKTPIYPHSAAYARENGELAQYRASLRAFSACKSAIDSTIRSHWDGMNFPKGCAKKVLEQFGPDQVSFILAYTVHERNFDNRFSGHNASWADTISTFGMGHGLESCTLESHPAKVDLFIDLVRSDLQELAKQKSTERQARSADHGKKVFKLDKTPIYKETFAYAYEHGEAEQHRASLRANIACKDAIVMAINDNYRENRLNTAAAVKEVVQQFGFERMFYVLANTLQTMDSDGRISQANKQWAQSVPVVFEQGKRDMTYLITQSHPGLLNMFANEARHEHLLRQPLKAADIKAEAEHIMQRLQSEQEPNSPNGTHYMAQISPDFLARAKTKDTDRLMAMLPFQSLSFSTLEGRKGTYALISRDENRFQKLVLRKPSVRKKIQEQSAAVKPPAKKKSKEQER